jgi:predicted signal transduction protein with EAL and GGDEF domain
MVARLGGDQFALLQRHVGAATTAERLAERVIARLSEPFAINGHDIAITASVGIARAPLDADGAMQLVRCAELAMYQCKAEGRGCARSFLPEMDAALQARLALERAIREATHNETFELHFQPIVEAKDGALVGFETLLRLRGADGALISPATFIPVAEQMGLIGKIGAWVIGAACRAAASWPDHLTVSVNLSPAQFAKAAVHGIVAAALAKSGLPARRLELEITESLLLEDTGAVLAELAKLKALGVGIVMDDFGTGYSSLSYLWRFPFSRIKIDRSFLLGLATAEKDARAIVETIVTLARVLDMRVTVEGVEERAQLAFVHGLGPVQAQGFHFGRPMPLSDVPARILSDFHRTRHQQANDDAPAQAASRTIRRPA